MTTNGKTLAERVSILEEQMDQALKGVNNFRTFQLDATKKIGFVYGFTRASAWILGIVCPLVIGLLIWFLTTLVIPAGKLIIDDYYRHHPQAQMREKEVSHNVEEALELPQDAAR